MRHLLTWLLFVPLALFGQTKDNKTATPGVGPAPASTPAPAPAPVAVPSPAPLTPPPDAYLFTPEDLSNLRLLQYQVDQLEIADRGKQLEIEQNKQKQAALLDQMRSIAYDLAIKRGIDLSKYELDPLNMKMTKKKPVIGAK